jgi:hypothetical protein
MLLLALAACSDYEIKGPAPEPLTLSLQSPTYGAFLGDGPIVVEGTVTPVTAFLSVNGVVTHPDEEGNFTAELPFDDRAVVVDVVAAYGGERLREVIPVFDGQDPRSGDPGAIAGLLTPTGLDALEPMVADLVDSLGWEDLLFSVLPTLDTDYVDLTPIGLTSNGAVADLAPAEDSVSLTVALTDVTLLTDVTVLDAYTFELGISLGTIGFGAHATPWVDDDGMIGFTLSDAIVDIGDIGISVEGFEIPEFITDLLLDPVASLVSLLGDSLGDLLLEQVDDLVLGGPFAFDLDLLGTPLSARLVEVGADLTGVGLGLTVGYGDPAADEMPDIPALDVETPAGREYELGLSVHEGMLNVLIDETLAGFLDIDLRLEGEYGELLGSGIASLDGGEDIPDEANGYCLGLHVGEARVVRLVEGTGQPLARAYLPDLQVDIDTVQGSDCVDWLDASVFAVLDLSLDGTEVSADLDVRDVAVLSYGADDYDLASVETQLGAVVESLAGLLGGQLSFDLGDALGDLGGLGISFSPEVVSIEPLDDQGLYGIYLNVFGTDL